jgi:DNA mismatch repair ATPase MutS
LDKIVQRIQREQDSYEKLNKLEKQVSQLTTHIESLKEIKNDNKVSLHIKHINDMYDRNDKRISKIEEVIIDDPAKAINLVLSRIRKPLTGRTLGKVIRGYFDPKHPRRERIPPNSSRVEETDALFSPQTGLFSDLRAH